MKRMTTETNDNGNERRPKWTAAEIDVGPLLTVVGREEFVECDGEDVDDKRLLVLAPAVHLARGAHHGRRVGEVGDVAEQLTEEDDVVERDAHPAAG